MSLDLLAAVTSPPTTTGRIAPGAGRAAIDDVGAMKRAPRARLFSKAGSLG